MSIINSINNYLLQKQQITQKNRETELLQKLLEAKQQQKGIVTPATPPAQQQQNARALNASLGISTKQQGSARKPQVVLPQAKNAPQQQKPSVATNLYNGIRSYLKQAPINAVSPLAQFIPGKYKEAVTNAVGNFAGGVAQSVPREMMSLALQERIAKQKVADTIKKKTGVSVPFLNQKSAPETQFTPKTGFEKFVLGNEKVVPAQQYGEEQIKALPFGIGKKVSNKTASRFAVPLVIGSVASNFFGGKAEVKGIEEALTAAKDVGTATKILKKAGVADDLIKEYAPILAKTSKADEVSKIVSHLDDLSKTTQEAAKPIIGGIKKAIAPTENEVGTYLKELEQQQKIARGGKVGNIVSKAAEFYKEAKVKLVDSLSPIEDTLRAAEKEGKYKLLPKYNISESGQLDKVLRIPSQVEKFAEANGLNDIIQEAPNLSHLDQYVLAKRHVLDLADKGIETGRNLDKDKKLIEALAPQYEGISQQVVSYSHKLLDTAVDGGLISKDLAQKLKVENPNYVPMQRIFSELEQEGLAHNGTKAVASLSKQSVVKRMLGSTRAIESPIQSLMEKTNDLVKQVEINKAAQMLASYEKLPGNPFGIVPLRTAENVEKRIKTLQELGDIFAEKRKLERGLKTANKSVQKLTKKIGTHENEIESLIEEARVKASEFESPSQINNLLDKTLTRERKIHSLEADLLVGKDVKKQQELQGLIQERKGSISELRHVLSAARDIPKNVADQTISVFKNGIKEVYKVNPDIAQAAKNLNQAQIGLLGQIFAVPTRIGKAGITGFNQAFIASNLLKDQLFSMVTSSVTRKTAAIANPANFVRSLFEAVTHGDLYDEIVRNGAMSTSFDVSRNQLPQTVARIRSGRSLTSKALYTVRHPGELFRAVENIIGRSEELTRIQQYAGTKSAFLKQGRTVEDATMLAAKAARENTANFARSGEWGRALNGAIMYLNASIQGSRSLVRAFRANPVATASKIATTVLLPSAIITAYNLNDPERKKIYEDIPEYEKEQNLIIIPPGSKQDENGKYNVIKIPLPPGLSNFTSLVRRPLEAANGLDPVKFMDIASPLLGLSPINIVSNGKISARAIASSLLPQGIKPTIEGVTNTDLYTGAPQVSRKYQDLSPELQVAPDTSGVARIVANRLRVSPIKTQAFVKGTFGETGLNVLNAADRAAASLGVIPQNQIGGRSFGESLRRRFSEAQGGAVENKQYKEADKAKQESLDRNFLLKEKAQNTLNSLKTLNKDEANSQFAVIKQQDPELAAKIADLKKEADLDMTATEKVIKSMNVKDRATFLLGKFNQLKTREQKNSLADDYRRKGILTQDVESQLRILIKGSQ